MKKCEKWLSILFVIIMLLTAVCWGLANHSWSITGTAAAAVCFALFVLLGLRTIPVLSAYILFHYNTNKVALGNKTHHRREAWLYIVCWLLVSRCLLLILAYALDVMFNGYSSGLIERFTDTWNINNIDATHYLGIAQNGYVNEGDARFHIVFLPLYPILVSLVHYFVGSYLLAGFLASNLCTIVAALYAYELAAMDMNRRNAMRAVKYIFIYPSAFFFMLPMTEALFLMLSLMCLYYVRRKKWLLGCIFGALAAFTRSPGVLLAVPVMIEFARELIGAFRLMNRRAFVLQAIKATAYVAVLSLGLLGYLYMNYAITGNPFQFSIYQREHWFQRFYLFFDTARYQLEYAVGAFRGGDYQRFLGMWLPNIVSLFAALIIMLMGAKKLNPSYTAYFIVYFVFIAAPTWLISGPRYLVVAFPLAFAAVLLTRRRAWDYALTVAYVGCSVLYLAMYVAGYPVF